MLSDIRNHLCYSSLYLFYFISVETRIALHIRDVDGQGICSWRIRSLFLSRKLRAISLRTLLAVLQLAFLCLFLPFEACGVDDS